MENGCKSITNANKWAQNPASNLVTGRRETFNNTVEATIGHLNHVNESNPGTTLKRTKWILNKIQCALPQGLITDQNTKKHLVGREVLWQVQWKTGDVILYDYHDEELQEYHENSFARCHLG